MRSRLLSSLFIPALFALGACQPAVGPLSDADIAAIDNLGSAYQEAALAGDWDTWAAFWTEDARYQVPNMPILLGRAAIRESVDLFPTLTEMNFTVDEVEGLGHLAWARGTFRYSALMEGEEVPVGDAGSYLWVLEKQPDGSWLVAAECYNSDLPLPDSQEM